MPRKPRNVRSRDPHARQEIAAAAARLIAEDGVPDYGLAKRKAAHQLGLPDDTGLPNNDEVAEALRAYLAIYQDEDQPAQLLELRRIALEALRFFAPFSPYLVGSVLDGTAGRYSEIEIEAYAESAKDVELFMLSRSVVFEHARVPRAAGESVEAVFDIDWAGAPVRLAVYHTLAERVRARTRSGRPQQRAREAALASLIEEGVR